MTPLIPYEDLCSKYTPEQYKQSSRLLGIINAILKQCDDLEIAFFEILQALSLADAMGPALDYLGAIVGISRNVGEDDESYRVRIGIGRSLVGLPTPEALRRVLQFITSQSEIGLYPCYPAGLYFVLYEHSLQELPTNLDNYYTSGVDVGQGTFLTCEDGELWGLIVLEDNGQPMVIDQRWPEILCVITEDGDYVMTEDNDYVITEANAYTPNVGTVTIGGRVYKTVTIGAATWLAENLDYKFDGCGISTSENPIAADTTEPSAWYYDEDEAQYGLNGTKKCGLLYNWYAIDYLEQHKDTLIPGWHVPTSAEWDSLVDAVGGANVAALKLKARDGYIGDLWPSGFGGSDEFDFCALPGGRLVGDFRTVDSYAEFWCAADDSESAYVAGRSMRGNSNVVAYAFDYRTSGRSVRLVKDY